MIKVIISHVAWTTSYHLPLDRKDIASRLGVWAKNAQSESNHEEIEDKPKVRGFLQLNCLTLFKMSMS